MRRIGVLINAGMDDPEYVARLTDFRQGLTQLGWSEGRNVRMEIRWAGTDGELMRRYAAELVALGPDVILANSGIIAGVVQQTTRTVPIVFVRAIDPVGAGLVASLAHPGGNATGFAGADFSLGAKRLELLKQIAPGITRVAVLRDPSAPAGSAIFGAIQATASSFRMEAIPIDTRDVGGLERDVTAFAQTPNGGMILAAPAFAVGSRGLILSLEVRHRLPAIYPIRSFVTAGGLMSYATVEPAIEHYRLAAGYVDRILKGEKPADLPVQAPTKYELVINLKTAKALGITVPQTLFARADEVIE